jgi:hypothetical protein
MTDKQWKHIQWMHETFSIDHKKQLQIQEIGASV